MAEAEQAREQRRLRALAAYEILDTPPEADFDDLVELAAELCETPIALVSLIDESRQWFKARRGVDLAETSREIAFCTYALDCAGLLEVEDATRDPRFVDNPLVTGEPRIRFYAGAPLRTPEGEALGTLCVIDTAPRTLNERQRRVLNVLARQVMHQLELRRRLREERRIEEKLRDSEHRFRLLADATNDAVWDWDLLANRVVWNAGFETLFGFDRAEIEPTADSWYSRIHPDDRERVSAGIHDFIESGRANRVWQDEYRFARKQGGYAIVRDRGFIQLDDSGHAVRMLGGMTDMTELREMQQALQQNSELMDIASDAARIGGWRLELNPRRVIWSDAVRRIHEVPDDYQPEFESAVQFYPPRERSRLVIAIDECITYGKPFDLELQFTTASGRTIWVRGIGRPLRDADGNICAVQGAFQDIDTPKRNELALDQLGRQLQTTLESISDALLTFDRDWRITYMNPRAEELLMRSRDELLGKVVWEEFKPALETSFHTYYQQAMSSGETVTFVEYYEPLATWFDVSAYPTPEGLAVYFRDINERKAREYQLRRQALLLSQAKDAIIVRDLDDRIGYWNVAAERLYGWHCDEVLGQSVEALLYPEDSSAYRAATRQAIETGEWSGRLVQRRRDGGEVVVEGHWTLIREEGRPDVILAINTDIGEKLELEARLAQAQKLETIGQLTGGVAHDFNNLLTVIIGNAELLAEEIAADSPLGPIVDLVRTAADRGAELTNRLLAFARRQALEPRVVAPVAVIDGMGALLRRTLGEGVEVELFHEPGLWPVFVDATQLETALLNLCVNARDAMPQGGKLTIESANVVLDDSYVAQQGEVAAGNYVQISVADTGSGMPPELLARAFEPFFTTKAKGKGTGLGLSMVYGFVKQSGGHVTLYSEPGVGTAVHLYLPRAEGVIAELPDTAPVRAALPGAGEQILLVEDDALVREHARRLLRDLGYRVTEAASGVEALALLREGLQVDLLFTDVIMPGGLNGPQLAAAAHAILPALPVLFTSGYTENAIVHHGRVDAGVLLLHKPYRRQTLAEKVHLALQAARVADNNDIRGA